ncbi:flagellar hook-basal body protein [Paenibacillus sp.]|uniref:flagellar hook-basal body protein n=1 Tax=Paenibacillus sp. TaxID=58172 RepID=UPI002D65001A|nr:flagellar hook-basal body protein [Paenibacillus sp.]HZG87363.1 flagellar hook-basal body protein [Paenibacillus sp.]
MLRGLNTAAAGMIANQRRHDTVTNNIANLNTPGYKANNAVQRSFPEMLISLMGGGDGTNAVVSSVGRLNTGVFAEEAPALYLQGDLMETKDWSDFAIVSNIGVPGVAFDAAGKFVSPDGEVQFQPQAMFAVRTSSGDEKYTRNGKFTIDAAGQLVTSEGHLVLDAERRPIRFDQNVAEVKITSSGELIDGVSGGPLTDENGLPISFLIARIDNPNRLIREGNGNFRLPEGDELPGAVAPEDDVQVFQGFVERSNVDPVQTTIDLMAAQRAYETNQRVVQFYDKSLEKAVNEVGRV